MDFKNRDRFFELGLTIAHYRKLRGMTQEQLAEKAGISRSQLSIIEAPNIIQAFSLDIFYNIADALNISPGVLLDTKLPS
ncbi:MAG: helix-turn-helix transcriptional regulator [Clostridia bacterium]|nr:helix-turn-helix transcriptional regulator [Clostridia bacterium]